MGRPNIQKKILEIDKSNENPFAKEGEFVIPINVKKIKRTSEEGVEYTSEVQLDATDHVKLFPSVDFRTAILKKSGNANKLFLHISLILKGGADIVYLPKAKYMKLLNIKAEKTFYGIIQELEQIKLLKRLYSKKNQDKTLIDYYWINPAILFKGARKNKYPFNIKMS